MTGFDSARRERLEKFDTFDKVLERLLRYVEIVAARVCEDEDLGPRGCWRPEAVLNVESEAFDAFFNSPGGYRAQYLSDPDHGQAANNRLLRALEPKLTNEVVNRCGEKQLSREKVRDALLANSAKIWPDEDSLDFTQATIDLAVERWKQPCDWINAPKYAGLWAPEGTRLKVIGAFIDPWGNEVVSRVKVRRRFDIHECGFS
ncbi:MAG: hypothetical protein Q7N50_10280 [Armatimonadota bacterium]|nr:hypothetical protein [Armatimonadota bacterium]